MARLRLWFATLPVAVALGQQPADDQFRKAGVCARCHVISVVEWGISGHSRPGTDCIACHGASEGHVLDERNNVKPERVAQGEAIAAQCSDCHSSGCPKAKRRDGCQGCHHHHALLDPNKPPEVRDERLEKLAADRALYEARMREAEDHFRKRAWRQAGEAFRAALEAWPRDARAAERLKACERRLAGPPPGFVAEGGAFDEATGLPPAVRVEGLGLGMVLVGGGEFEIGSERFRGAVPVHCVRLAPFYLARHEVTQADWCAVMGAGAEGCTDPASRLPVTAVSWQDVQRFLDKLNARVPGGGFRLPTEAEWEAAARAGGALEAGAYAVAVYAASGGESGPQPVGSKAPDRLGIFDLLGNVAEWCSSLDRPYPYDPLDGREDPRAAGMRIVRGGGWADTADLLDPALRHAVPPQRRLGWVGFRPARSVPEAPPLSAAAATPR